MSSNCNNNKCKIIPLAVAQPQNARFSDQLKRNTMKTIYQGQPSNIIITRVLSDSAVIEFNQIGNPINCLIELSSKGMISNTYTVVGGHNTTKFQATGLLPGTLYEINVIVTYVSGDQFSVNHKKTFITLNKWKVPSVSYIYPRNKTMEVTQNIVNYTAIDLSFDLSPGTPTRYIIEVDNKEIHSINSYYLKPQLYPIFIRNNIDNNIGSVVKVITEYNDDQGYNDVSFTHVSTLSPFLEGASLLESSSITEGAMFIDISFSKAPGDPVYNFYLRKSLVPYTKMYQKQQYSNGRMDISLSDFDRDTEYTINIETYYSQTNNTYRYSEDILFKTFNHSPIQNVRFFATSNMLTYSFDSPTGDFLNSEQSYFSMILKDDFGNEISSNSLVSKTTTEVTYSDLSTNAAYTFLATSYYSDVLFYSYEKSDNTLYEGEVSYVQIYNIQGSTVDISYESFTLPSGSPSIPDYYIIKYTDETTMSSNSIQTYNKTETLTNLLTPNTPYIFNVTSIYSSGNKYEFVTDSVQTENEGPVQRIIVDRLKGDRVDLIWENYDGLSSPSTFQVRIDSNLSLNNFVDWSFNRLETDIDYESGRKDFLNLIYGTEYRFTFISDYYGKLYSRSVIITTPVEYSVKLSNIFQDTTSIEINKEPFSNNQNEYIFVREQNITDIDSFLWIEQGVRNDNNSAGNNPNPEHFTGENTTFNNIEMSKNGDVVLFCSNLTEIQKYKLTENKKFGDILDDTESYYSQELTITPGKPISSMSLNYTGNIFIVGFNDHTVYLYADETPVDVPYVISVSNTTSKSVVLCPLGNIFAVSNGDLRDGIFIMDVNSNQSYTYFFPDLIISSDNWFQSVLNKYVQFNENGSTLAIGFELFYFPIDGTTSSINTCVKILDLTNDSFSYTSRNIDVSGSRISLNRDGTKIAVVDNYDVSENSIMYGSVCIYDISLSNPSSSLVVSNKFWGSENVNYPMYRNCSINDAGNIVAIGEFNVSYKTNPTFSIDGQILVHELSGTSWSLKGFPIRLKNDVKPSIDSDTILTGEWFGYKLILDSTGYTVLASTRPKLNMDLSIYQGKGYIYKWNNNDDIYKFKIVSWPVVVSNLIPDETYNFRIYSTYGIDPDYSYLVDISASTLTGKKPDVSYSIYNDSIQLSWKSVTWENTNDYQYLQYTIQVSQGNQTLVDVSMAGMLTVSRYDISYNITNLTPNTPYEIIVSSDYTRIVDESIYKFIYKNEALLSTLNERASDISNIIVLNSNNLVVFDIENAGLIDDISQNKITLNVRDLSYSFIIVPPAMLDIREFQTNDRIRYSVETTYKKQPNSGVFAYNNSTYVSLTGILDVSDNTFVPDTLVRNGRFEPIISYNTTLALENIFRYPVDIVRGIYKTIPPDWSTNSKCVYAIENQNKITPNVSFQKFLNVYDISYHAVLFRTEEFAYDGTRRINPASLIQELHGIVFAQPYNITFYLRNQNNSSAFYDSNTKTYFSDEIKYQIEFADVLNNDYIFYKTSPIRNTNTDWAKFQCLVNFPISRKKVKYTIRRLDQEANNLLISDVSMAFTSKKNKPFTLLDSSSWNCLNGSAITSWKDIWTYDGSFQVVQLSGNMSISCWVYVHYTDVSHCIFLLGTDISNGTPGIYIDNSNIVVKNVYEDSSFNNILSIPSVLGVPTHFVLTYFNNTISSFVNGTLVQTVDVSENSIREASTNDNIYLGDPYKETFGVVLKSVKLYDYQLDISFISNSLYYPDKTSYQIGNPIDISNYKITHYIENHGANERHVTMPVLNKPDLNKSVFLNSSFYYRDVSSVSMWIDASSTLFIDNSYCECTTKTFTFRENQIKLNHAVNHFVITSEKHSLKLYMNGYLYLTDNSPITTISGSNLGEVTFWNKILSESDVLTSYYNYYTLYSTYDLSGQYNIFVKYPKGISVRDVSYNVSSSPYNAFIDRSGTFYLSEENESSSVVISLDPLTLNTVNMMQRPISVRLLDYDVLHEVSLANNPFIQYNYSNIQYLTEATTIDFWLENIPENYGTTPYNISTLGITGPDLSYSLDIIGTIGSYNTKYVSIAIKEDYTIEEMESLIFNVPSLNLSTLLYIYDRLYFSTTKSYAQNGEVFTITLRNKMTTPDTSFNYQIFGVSKEDISGVDLSGTIYFKQTDIVSNISTVDVVPLSMVDISFTVTANEKTRTNLPFQLVLTDYSHVNISIWLNDYYTLTANQTEIKEGDDFSFTLKLPHTVQNNTAFAYTITGISSEDLDTSSTYGDLSGYFISNGFTATQNFKYKYNALPNQNKTLQISVSDLSLSSRIIHVEPMMTIRGPTEVNEGEPFTIILEDLSKNLPNATIVKYTVVYVDSISNLPLTGVSTSDVSANSDVFTFDISNTASVTFTATADYKTEGGKVLKIMLLDFPNVFWMVSIYDTSQFPIYTLRCDKILSNGDVVYGVSSVNEGDTFKITLEYSNLPSGSNFSVPFDISGIGLQDISGLLSLRGEFTIPDEVSKYYTLRNDRVTERKERIEFRLTAQTNSSIMVFVDISDTSQSPTYKLNIEGSSGNTFFVRGDVFTLVLTTSNVQIGAMVPFNFYGLSNEDLSVIGSNSLTYSNSTYTGLFTAGYNERISLKSNVSFQKTSILTLSSLPFTYNDGTTEVFFQDINFKLQDNISIQNDVI